MLGFLEKLTRWFTGTGDYMEIESWWCDTFLISDNKVKTPLGSRVTQFEICVDIRYSVDGEDVRLHRVQLSCTGGTIGGRVSINIASKRTGEAWFVSRLCGEGPLAAAVRKDLEQEDSQLKDCMLRKWYGAPDHRRSLRPTEKQLRYARHLGIAIPEGISRDDLSDVIRKVTGE